MNIALLAEICQTPGIPGKEGKVRALVARELTGIADEISVDNMGNLTAILKGKSDKRVMAAAHMDEIGFVVTHIDDNGFVRFHTLGGFDAKTLTSQRVVIHGKEDLIGVMGSKPVHVMSAEERTKMPKTTDYFIDLGMKADKVKELVTVGDAITRERELIEMGDCVNCKSLDNRVSVFILIETIKALKAKDLPYDFYAVFTVQEEVGIRGAQAATLAIQPHFAFGLDTTIAFDVPGAAAHEKITELGKGAAIKLLDGSVISDYRMIDFMKQTADRNKITWQPEILTAGGTDTSALQKLSAGGSIAGAVSIPTRHIHQVIEMCHKEDIASSIALLSSCVAELDQYNWTHDLI